MIAGETRNFLTAMEFDHRTPKASYWRFLCVCGDETVVRRTRDVEIGSTKSCGCMKGRLLSERPTTWAKEPGVAAKNGLLSSYRTIATKKGLPFALTPDEFAHLTSSVCHYCDIEPMQSTGGHRPTGEYIYNGIDRLDNELGYTLANCVPCCGTCNVAKNNLTVEEFATWVARLVTCQLRRRSSEISEREESWTI